MAAKMGKFLLKTQRIHEYFLTVEDSRSMNDFNEIPR